MSLLSCIRSRAYISITVTMLTYKAVWKFFLFHFPIHSQCCPSCHRILSVLAAKSFLLIQIFVKITLSHKSLRFGLIVAHRLFCIAIQRHMVSIIIYMKKGNQTQCMRMNAEVFLYQSMLVRLNVAVGLIVMLKGQECMYPNVNFALECWGARVSTCGHHHHLALFLFPLIDRHHFFKC